MANKKMLMITYLFPPRGGGGVQRNVKFLKYLTRLGWETSVLTVKETGINLYDSTLLDEINSNIFRAGSFDPHRVFAKLKNIFGKSKPHSFNQSFSKIDENVWYVRFYRKVRDVILLPDVYGGWIPFAVALGGKLIKTSRPDILFCSFPWPSNAFVTYILSKKFNIPYVLDFRDGWIDNPYTLYSSILHRRFHEYYERKIVANADKIIVYGEILRDFFVMKYPVLRDKIEVITNGFDPEDFDDLRPVAKTENKVRLVYSGSAFGDRRENFINFLEALFIVSEFIQTKLEIIFVGKKLKWAQEAIELKKLEKTINFTGYLPHKEALNYLASADAALLFLPKGDTVSITGKVFEYIGFRLPIIACIEKNGACARLLKSINHDQGICDPSSPEEIADKIELLVNSGLPKLNNVNMTQFSRKVHSERLSRILEEIV